jgi:hypothetical protein
VNASGVEFRSAVHERYVKVSAQDSVDALSDWQAGAAGLRAPKTYTQPQPFACLVLKEFLHRDYRG